MFTRNRTRALRIGNLPLGGGAPVSVQTMLNDDPHDAAALAAHLEKCAAAGADLVRLTVPDAEAAKTLGEVRRRSPVPLVADVHFDYRCALAAIEAGVDALRLNPGNVGGRANVQAVARAAKAKGVPIRIGVNGGSLDKALFAKHGSATPAALVESALQHLKLLEDEGFRDVVVSAKASDVARTLETYRLLAEKTDCPLHLGVTEAGTFIPGTVRNSVALGILLSEGIGDTIRVSLTDTPEKEVKVGLEILRALGMKAPGPSITSCPTCGRTRCDLFGTAERVEAALEALHRERPGVRFPHVAVMGCVVNGPGEAKGADVALCGGEKEFLLYVRGSLVKKVAEGEAVDAVLEAVKGNMP
ncbi:MAG: flavodoxin-dependent (E)-4-hydroxy-3-methylbut-2-enyl-diphosphate synthase [Kiritimatiellae bacterium]|nr:flavodoxin-dependent (E)-4-hydroxy-3-methylbut-2-enyl-diphosphate synthase [Kiritimatiellia bacterium]